MKAISSKKEVTALDESMAKGNKAWERMPAETLKQFNAFRAYLELGDERDLDKAAKVLGKTKALVADWSSRNHWQQRITLWNDYIVQRKTKIMLKELDEMHKRVARHAYATETALMTAVESYIKRYKNGEIKFDDLSISEHYNLILKAADKLGSITDTERKARGEPTEITKSESNNTHEVVIKVVNPRNE